MRDERLPGMLTAGTADGPAPSAGCATGPGPAGCSGRMGPARARPELAGPERAESQAPRGIAYSKRPKPSVTPQLTRGAVRRARNPAGPAGCTHRHGVARTGCAVTSRVGPDSDAGQRAADRARVMMGRDGKPARHEGASRGLGRRARGADELSTRIR